MTREDSAYMLGGRTLARHGVASEQIKPLVEGEFLRDWAESGSIESIWPYAGADLRAFGSEPVLRLLWPMRRLLRDRVAYGATQIERGLEWFEYSMFFRKRYEMPLSIAFAFVATHNHFVLDRGGKVFKQSAPVIKLPADATEDDHLRLLGLLNSSTACFWLKQVSHNKGSTVDAKGARQTTVEFENFYEFTGTKLEEFPLPSGRPLDKAKMLDQLAEALASSTPSAVAGSGLPTRQSLAEASHGFNALREQMIAVQEELDWETYQLYGLLAQDFTYPLEELPAICLGQRAFEIVLARHVAAGEAETTWFSRHRSTPITDVPSEWPAAYADLVRRRIEIIETRPDIALIERPECKRRWATEPWEKQETAALRDWLFDRLEALELWTDSQGRPVPQSMSGLADKVAGDADLVGILALWSGDPDVHVPSALARLLDGEAVPYLAADRYSATGLRKRADWETTWELQRAEDRGEVLEDPIPVPPKYGQGDFAKVPYWKHRGKLDVPKERFILYPGAGRDNDPSPVLGWAGWDHLVQAQALATLVGARRDGDGWGAVKLTPLLAGMAELEPWLHQWHSESAPLFGGSPAAWFTRWLEDELSSLELTRVDLASWRPAAPVLGRRTKA